MTTPRTQSILELSSSLSPDSAKSLLAMGLSVSNRPIDRVINHLRANRGHEWLEQSLEQLECDLGLRFQAMPSDGALSVQQLREAKDSIKLWIRDTDRDKQPAGVLGYFLVLALALRDHGELISEQPEVAVSEALSELSGMISYPWDHTCVSAVERLHAMMHE